MSKIKLCALLAGLLCTISLVTACNNTPDEPDTTAAVDTETEKSIQEALERLSKGRTVLSIAHRISTLRNADKLIVIDKGRIVEYGTHDELVALDGTYCKLVKIQNEALKFRAIGE